MAEIKLMNVDSITNQLNTKVEVEYIPKVVATTPADGQILVYESGQWVNKPLPEGGIPELTRDDSGPTYTDYVFG